jgi:hypothetical protein
MSSKKFEHKDELDCEVTVFEGAHTTCDKTEDADAKAVASKKSRSRRRKYTDEDFDPRMIS